MLPLSPASLVFNLKTTCQGLVLFLFSKGQELLKKLKLHYLKCLITIVGLQIQFASFFALHFTSLAHF